MLRLPRKKSRVKLIKSKFALDLIEGKIWIDHPLQRRVARRVQQLLGVRGQPNRLWPADYWPASCRDDPAGASSAHRPSPLPPQPSVWIIRFPAPRPAASPLKRRRSQCPHEPKDAIRAILALVLPRQRIHSSGLEIRIGLTCGMLLCLCERSLAVSAVFTK